MDQVKIGKFIALKRKEIGITQQQLADKLGVTDKSIGNWENGRNMPDLSLFEPLCKELNISINDLMSGEVVEQEDYKIKCDENITYTINEVSKQEKRKAIILIIICIILMLSILIFTDAYYGNSMWYIYYIVSGLLFDELIDLLNIKNNIKKCIITLLIILGCSFMFDYLCVLVRDKPPLLAFSTKKIDDIGLTYEYDCLFYKYKKVEPWNQNSDWVIEYIFEK